MGTTAAGGERPQSGAGLCSTHSADKERLRVEGQGGGDGWKIIKRKHGGVQGTMAKKTREGHQARGDQTPGEGGKEFAQIPRL